ncbi:MarR family winged helix-turn-helix transcriptional regulator [Jiella mangrovi]|uniref:MarR family transcriptional regulator n=1 Tax=Jiella mangrovi TaxID=2821407 RepID=A0ABS4BLT8_9HYPH|nr:MarR family transcriptional regulator [Jiella mangrovi]MBP0617683.1 MarR family transcriptional regulator [Jiella mangrovi]
MSHPGHCEIVNAFHHLHGAVMSHVFPHMARFLKGQDISFQHLVAMFRIRIEGPQSVAAIAKEVELTHTAASRLVDRLVKAGLLDRAENPEDRRQKRLTLTPKGFALLEEFPAVTLRSYQAILAKLPEDVLAQLSGPMAELSAFIPPPPPPAEREG